MGSGEKMRRRDFPLGDRKRVVWPLWGGGGGGFLFPLVWGGGVFGVVVWVFGVWGLGFGVWGLGFRVWGLGFRV